MKTKTNSLTGENLKAVLWETLIGIKGKKISPAQGQAIAAQSREIIRVVRTEMALNPAGKSKPAGKMLLA